MIREGGQPVENIDIEDDVAEERPGPEAETFDRRQAPRARFGVVETVYWQRTGESPEGKAVRFGRSLTTAEEPYVRRILVGEEWQPLDPGWVEEAALMRLENEERGIGAVVEVGLAVAEEPLTQHDPDQAVHPVLLVPPGEAFRGSPERLGALRLRCRKGQARCRLTLIPF